MWQTGTTIADTMAQMGIYGLEKTHRRFYSKYKGKVEVNSDPQQQGRVQVSVADTGQIRIVGDAAIPETLELYAYPSSPYAGNNYGFYFPPEVGDQVWVWFDHGDPTQPHVSGGWWKNPGTIPPTSSSVSTSSDSTGQTKSVTKPPTASHVPVEFNSMLNAKINTNSGTPSLIPTSRGIKSRRGHGLILEDEALPGSQTSFLGRDTGLTLWTGAPVPTPPATVGQAPSPPKPAIRHHSIVMSDRDQEIHITTFGKGPTQSGHETVWDDFPQSQGIRTTSIYGHKIDINDVTQAITITTKLGHKLVLDDKLSSITASTLLGNTLTLDDKLQSASIVTPLKQTFMMSDKTLMTSITTPGAVTVSATGAATVTAGAAATITATGAMAISGTGLALTSSGGGPSVAFASGISLNTFTGLVTENYNGALTQIVVGAWNIAAPVANILCGLLKVGVGTPLYLVTQAFVDQYNTHTHDVIVTAFGTSVTGPPLALIPLSAPYITQNLQAS